MRLASMLVLCMLPGCSPGGGVSSVAKDDACTVAVRFTEGWSRERGGNPVVFSDEPESSVPRPLPAAWRLLSGDPGGAPSPSTLRTAGTLPTASAVARCPALRALLDRGRIKHGADAIKAAVDGRGADDSYPIEIFSLSLPSVSADGTEALVATGTVWGPEAGGGQILLLKRQADGSWHAVSGQPTWIS